MKLFKKLKFKKYILKAILIIVIAVVFPSAFDLILIALKGFGLILFFVKGKEKEVEFIGILIGILEFLF